MNLPGENQYNNWKFSSRKKQQLFSCHRKRPSDEFASNGFANTPDRHVCFHANFSQTWPHPIPFYHCAKVKKAFRWVCSKMTWQNCKKTTDSQPCSLDHTQKYKKIVVAQNLIEVNQPIIETSQVKIKLKSYLIRVWSEIVFEVKHWASKKPHPKVQKFSRRLS